MTCCSRCCNVAQVTADPVLRCQDLAALIIIAQPSQGSCSATFIRHNMEWDQVTKQEVQQ